MKNKAPTANEGFFNKVYEAVKRVPRGKVTTYGDVARLCGNPRMARQVGLIPCHRVVFSNGSVCTGFAFGGKDVQKAMLEDEGVEVSPDYKIDLKKYRWEI